MYFSVGVSPEVFSLSDFNAEAENLTDYLTDGSMVT